MKFFLILFVFSSGLALAQENPTNTSLKTLQVFDADEEKDIEKWFYELDEEMNLSDSLNTEYQQLLNRYADKMETLSETYGQDASKIITEFKKLVEHQNTEVLALLNEDQFRIHVRKYKVLTWSVSDRLNQQ